jgi:lipoprotein-releasing system permease protein
MYKPFELFVGMRYLRSRRRNHFLSFISWFSLLGVVLGVAALVIVTSVMNGFESELKGRVLRFLPHGFIEAPGGQGMLDWPKLQQQLVEQAAIEGAAPYIRGHALLNREGAVRGVQLSAVDPALQRAVSEVDDYMLVGRMADLRPGEYGIVLGAILARRLRVGLQDAVTVVLPQVNVTPVGIFPRMRRFTVVGVFEVGAQLDASEVFIHLRDGQRLFAMGDAVQGMQLQVDNIYHAGAILARQQATLPAGYTVSDWSHRQGGLFQAVKMEKIMVSLMLFIIVAVAAFNIVSILTMMVMDRRSDIAVLRTMGASAAQVLALFLVQGMTIGLLGVFLGLVVGLPLALHIGDVIAWLETTLGFRVFDPSVYFITAMPSQLQMRDVLWTLGGSLFLTLLATLYPAWRAAQIQPAEVLRYE